MTLRSQSSAKFTILLVEDEPFVRDATRRILQNAGFQVLAAADAQEALAAYDHAEGNIDLLMTDAVLPGRSGMELAQDVRLRSSATEVLLTSGYGEDGVQCEKSGAHYLPKPYSRQSLLEKIADIFNARRFEPATSRAS
jgi:CheY-like chemotaxis protein